MAEGKPRPYGFLVSVSVVSVAQLRVVYFPRQNYRNERGAGVIVLPKLQKGGKGGSGGGKGGASGGTPKPTIKGGGGSGGGGKRKS